MTSGWSVKGCSGLGLIQRSVFHLCPSVAKETRATVASGGDDEEVAFTVFEFRVGAPRLLLGRAFEFNSAAF